ncbi:MAG: hypothetical protein PHP62_04830, partial [Candidatus Moranbacteria bacterium]|nr:hypothetical protein [Candidatus Moranbacteria bacterium]
MINMISKMIKLVPGLGVTVKAKSETINEGEKHASIKKMKNEILSVEDIYTTLSEAKEEIWRRWN